MKVKNKTNTIKKIARYSFYGLLIMTVILGFILLGIYIEIYYERHKDFFENHFKLKLKKRHRILKVMLKLTLYFLISITAIGFLILLGIFMRKFYVLNKGKFFKKLTSFREYNLPKSMKRG